MIKEKQFEGFNIVVVLSTRFKYGKRTLFDFKSSRDFRIGRQRFGNTKPILENGNLETLKKDSDPKTNSRILGTINLKF